MLTVITLSLLAQSGEESLAVLSFSHPTFEGGGGSGSGDSTSRAAGRVSMLHSKEAGRSEGKRGAEVPVAVWAVRGESRGEMVCSRTTNRQSRTMLSRPAGSERGEVDAMIAMMMTTTTTTMMMETAMITHLVGHFG